MTRIFMGEDKKFVVAYYDSATSSGTPWLVREHVRGASFDAKFVHVRTGRARRIYTPDRGHYWEVSAWLELT